MLCLHSVASWKCQTSCVALVQATLKAFSCGLEPASDYGQESAGNRVCDM